MFLEIFAAIMFVLIPLFLMLILKVQKGVKWWADNRRPNFHNFYFSSVVFYVTFIIQVVLIIFTSKKDLSINVLYVVLWALVFSVIFLVLCHILMVNIED